MAGPAIKEHLDPNGGSGEIDRIGPRPAIDMVRARAALQRIVASIAHQNVVASSRPAPRCRSAHRLSHRRPCPPCRPDAPRPRWPSRNSPPCRHPAPPASVSAPALPTSKSLRRPPSGLCSRRAHQRIGPVQCRRRARHWSACRPRRCRHWLALPSRWISTPGNVPGSTPSATFTPSKAWA